MKRMVVGISTLFLLACLGPLSAQDASAGQSPADNTQVNKRDRDASAPTADQQSEQGSDREIARQIRQAIVKDDSMSTYAHNIKVIVKDGGVTLKGPVRSDEEKQAIEAKAAKIAGSKKITNSLEVAPKEN